MTKRKDDTGLDFGSLRLGIERCDPDLLLGFYAEDARLSIVNAGALHAAPFELSGKAEIAKHLRVAFGPETSHRVVREAAVGEDRVTFREACEYPDGGRVWVETTLEVREGKIVCQADVVAIDPPADREEDVGQRSPTRRPNLTSTPEQWYPLRASSTLPTINRKGGSLMMSGLSSVAKRHPLITFFVLTYALTWLAWPVWAFGLYPNPVFSFGPFLVALLVLAITHGKSGVSGLLRRMVRWRVGIRWYAVAFLVPVAITLAATVLNVLLGAQAPSSADLGGWSDLLPAFFLILLIPGLGGAWEEPGWRGYALPKLQTGRSALFASLILGVLIAGWHLPLMVVGQVHYSDILSIMGAVIVFNWVFNSANGSVLIIMLMHAMNNTISGSFFSPMFSGAGSVRQGWLLAAVWCAVAIVVVIMAGPQDLSRKRRKQEEPTKSESATMTAPQTQKVKEVSK